MITIIAGTNRPNSSTLAVATYYQQQLQQKGHNSQLLSLIDLPANVVQTDLYGQRSQEFAKIQALVTATEKFLFVIPEYNGSFPGVLKLFIDCCRFPESFLGKKAALVGISSGKYGNIRGIEHFTGICNYIGLSVLPLRLHIPKINEELNEKGHLFQEDTLRFTAQQIEKFIAF